MTDEVAEARRLLAEHASEWGADSPMYAMAVPPWLLQALLDRLDAAERAVSAVNRIVQNHVEAGLEEWECSGCFPLRETGEHAIGCTYARAFYAVNGREPRGPE